MQFNPSSAPFRASGAEKWVEGAIHSYNHFTPSGFI